MTGAVLPGPALLFCPGDRPERFAKAAERADGVILDLEDAVRPEDKPAAREAIARASLDPARVIVRVNPRRSAEHRDDMAMLQASPFRTIMLAKTEDVDDVAEIGVGFRVIALCETARGVRESERIAAVDAVAGLMWGAEDLIASLGGASSRYQDGRYRDVARQARARVLLAAGAEGKAAIDAVYVDIADTDGLAAEAADAVASGFTATACIHPSQAAVIRAAYQPSAEELSWAQEVLHAAQTQRGAFRLHGRMIDEPVLRHARSVLHRAASLGEVSGVQTLS